MPVRPPPHCHYFDEKVAVVPLFIKEKKEPTAADTPGAAPNIALHAAATGKSDDVNAVTINPPKSDISAVTAATMALAATLPEAPASTAKLTNQADDDRDHGGAKRQRHT
jgi:hypothetical protein